MPLTVNQREQLRRVSLYEKHDSDESSRFIFGVLVGVAISVPAWVIFIWVIL